MSELLTSSASFKERTAFFSDKFITEQPVDKAGRKERIYQLKLHPNLR